MVQRTAVSTDPAIGTEIAGYRIEGVIGRGGMSVVYLAEDLSLGRLVALKLLAPELVADERFRERFVRESITEVGFGYSSFRVLIDAPG
jgi:serine/threonine protein kinase